MTKGILLKVSGVVAATVILGSALSGTTYAGTTSHKAWKNMRNNSATHTPTMVSYDRDVIVLIDRLQEQMNKLQRTQGNPGGPMIPASSSQVNPGGPMISASGSQVNPGGPMIPASGSQVNPGGPMIPASSSQVNPGGPMIPASGSQVNPGGPMIPASGSQVNPGGPIIPASSSQVNPGGPMIPASVPRFNPGGPMIPASSSNATAAAYEQLATAANLFTQMLRADEMDGKSTTVSADISQSNRILRALKSTFLTSTKSAKYFSFSSFTPVQLSAALCVTQILENMANNS